MALALATLPEPTAGIYCRISHDEQHDRLGVGRQEQDGRADLLRRSITLHRVYTDDDLSGSGKVARPEFDDLLEDLGNGTITVVWAWDLDRLFRGLAEFVRFVETCERVKATVIWQGGSANFWTGEGITELEFKALMARAELRKLKERVTRKMVELSEHGKWHGGKESFGYRQVVGPDGKRQLEIHEAEAAVIVEATHRVLAGETLGAVAKDLDARGLRTKTGKRWVRSTLLTTLTAARISGRVERHGAVTAEAGWPAIISPADNDRLRALLARRGGERADPRAHLLSGIAVCGNCGTKMMTGRIGKRRRYQCRSSVGFYGCGHVTSEADPLERVVTEQVIDRVDAGGLTSLLEADQTTDVATAERELTEVGAELRDLAKRRTLGQVFPEEADGIREALAERRQAAQKTLETNRRRVGLPEIDLPVADSWERLTLNEQRAVIKAMVSSVTVLPVQRTTGRRFDRNRVRCDWKM